eukprot:GSMAST32.ASY1.ANO1.2202.1 assembled CDS
MRLSKDEMDVDPEMTQYFKNLGVVACEEVEKELAWESARSEIQLKKLKAAFLDDIIFECIPMKAFESEESVSSFRVRKRDDGGKRLLSSHSLSTNARNAESLNSISKFNKEKNLHLNYDNVSNSQSQDEEKEDRKAMRKERQKRLAKLESQKPSANDVDPKHKAAIEDAIKNIGDFKLKMSEDYVVPKSKQLNHKSKQREVQKLALSLYHSKMEFNDKFSKLRDLKLQIIKRITGQNARIRAINVELGNVVEIIDPIKIPGEWPDEREKYTMDELLDFEMKTKNLSERKEAPKDNKVTAQSNMDEEYEKEALKLASFHSTIHKSLPEDDPAFVILTDGEKSQAEIQTIKRRNCILEYEKSQLITNNEELQKKFDTRLHSLRLEKLQLDRITKSAEIKLLVLYQELDMLRLFQEKDNAIAETIENINTEKISAREEYTKSNDLYTTKSAEMVILCKKKEEIFKEFQDLVGGDSNPHYTALEKIYLRKIKRAKKRNDGDEDNSEEEYSSSSEEEESESEDDEEEVCPVGCKQELYDNVKELREKRLDSEELISVCKKTCTDLEKAVRKHSGREAQLDKELEAADKKISTLMSEKQKVANQLQVVVAMRISQIKNLERPETDADNGVLKLPNNIDNCLVFSKQKLGDLRNTIVSHIKEKKRQLQVFKDLKKRQRRLIKDNRKKERSIKAQEEKCDALQRLKFGRKINLDSLDNMYTSQAVLDLQQTLKFQAVENAQVLRKLSRNVKSKQEELLGLTQKNTEILENIAKLSTKLSGMEVATSGESGSSSSGVESAQAIAERKRLVQVVRLQAREIDVLKTEINMLRKKGGHVYKQVKGPEASP